VEEDGNMTVGWMPLHGNGRAVPWVPVMVYGVVLAAGLYDNAIGLGNHSPARTAGFAAVMVLLLALEAAQQRWLAGERWLARKRLLAPGRREWPAVVVLAMQLGLFVAATALDSSGESRALFVLVPFAAYFAFGRAVSLALAAMCLVLLVADFTVRIPHWYAQPTYLSDVLMFSVGLVLAIAMANIAVGEQASRGRLEETLLALKESHAQLTAYAARVAELSAEAERNRLARDIHDSLGHHLTAIAIQLEKAAAFRERDQATADQALADARSSTRQALHDIRISVRALRGDHTSARLSAMLAELVRQADVGEQRVSLTVSGDESGVSPVARTVLYRSAQEALTNARRHSGARKITVSATFGEREARLVVVDDGRGFDPGPRENAPCEYGPGELRERRPGEYGPGDSTAGSEGFGLLGMRERAALAGGRAEIDSRPGGGTTVTVTVPRSATADLVVPPGAIGLRASSNATGGPRRDVGRSKRVRSAGATA
jgi:signal transduction histidine kinase